MRRRLQRRVATTMKAAMAAAMAAEDRAVVARPAGAREGDPQGLAAAALRLSSRTSRRMEYGLRLPPRMLMADSRPSASIMEGATVDCRMVCWSSYCDLGASTI